MSERFGQFGQVSNPPAAEGERPDDVGLSIDMLDVDRLRQYAQNLLTYGPDITHWASVPHVVSKLQTIATGIEKAVRDIGMLRRSSEKAPQSSDIVAALRLMVECYEKHDDWCGHNPKAPGDSIHRRAIEAARQALAQPSPTPSARLDEIAREACVSIHKNGHAFSGDCARCAIIRRALDAARGEPWMTWPDKRYVSANYAIRFASLSDYLWKLADNLSSCCECDGRGCTVCLSVNAMEEAASALDAAGEAPEEPR